MQRKLVKTRLERAGFVVDAVADARDALAVARESRPDLIVSDVVMPEMDGFELCRRVKNDAALAAIPVVLMSGLCSFRANHELARRVGAAALLERTPSFENELASVRLCISKLRDGDEPATMEAEQPPIVPAPHQAPLELAQKLQELGQLVSGTAHDLNNIFTVILSYASFLLHGQAEDDRGRSDAEAIKAAVERATMLTRQLRAAASVYAPGTESPLALEDYPQIRRALSWSNEGCSDDGVKVA
ncbi:MAG: response regulator [Myxococcota bacterium]|nr:response regulator [Myxococcota bacterium]